MSLEKNLLNPFGRIELFAIIAGFLISLASLYLSTSLAAAFGHWPFRLDEGGSLYEIFWTVAAVVWFLSLTIGCFVTMLVAQSRSLLNGVLNSALCWSCSFLFFGGISVRIAALSPARAASESDWFIFWHGFVPDVAGLFVAILVGILIRLGKRMKLKIELKNDSDSLSANILNNLDPAKY